MASHFIQRQIIELHVPQAEDARRLQDRLAAHQPALLRLMETECEAVAGDTAVVSAGRIVIDLGVLDARELEPQFLSAFQREFAQALAGLARQPLPAGGETSTLAATTPQDLLLHYLRTGTLPWSARSSENGAHPVLEAVKKLLTGTARPPGLLPLLLSEPAALERLVFELPEPLLAALLHQHAALPPPAQLLEDAADLRQAAAVLPSFTALSPGRQKLLVWRALVTGSFAALEKSRPLQAASAFHLLVGNLLPAGRAAEAVLALLHEAAGREAACGGETGRTARRRLWSGALLCLERGAFQHVGSAAESGLEWLHELAMAAGTTGEALLRTHAFASRSGREQQRQAPGAASPAGPRAPGRPAIPASHHPTTSQPVENGSLVANTAGLVLLWPFLAHFFRRCGLLSEDSGSFAGEDRAERAVLLLHFVATGETSASGAFLALPRLLCGLDWHRPTPVEFEPSEFETAEASALLSAVIAAHKMWDTLTHDAFRQAWLQRPGLLRQNPGAWQLHVERQPYDVILDRLPWPLEIVRLPWMAEPLNVAWHASFTR